jgi:hypothetical protein
LLAATSSGALLLLLPCICLRLFCRLLFLPKLLLLWLLLLLTRQALALHATLCAQLLQLSLF